MYEEFYGLRERPFELTSDPKYLLLTPRHREALANLQYGISGRRGITLLIGEAGTGKTSIIAAALAAERERNLCVAHLANPSLTRDEFFELLASAFGLSAAAAQSKGRFLLELQEAVIDRQRDGGLTALIIDEAQSLPHALLEEVRLLANIESPTEKLLPVVLAGQPELADRLNDPSLRQLKQRVALRCTLVALDLSETAAYIATRIRTAGGQSARVFTREAVIAIHHWSKGIPRTINVICDNVLLGGFAADCRPAGVKLVEEVCRDFDFGAPTDATIQPASRLAAPSANAPLLERRPAEAPPLPQTTQTAAAADTTTGKELFSALRARRRFLFFTGQ